ncbi:MAG: PrsW family glutamic-type intramembrane protease [Patescibacteria group bacterium]|nr:PrsW family glutamic-type intramembrane protease [Patescibacteria group bacterium]
MAIAKLVVAAAFGLLPTLIWLLFFLREDSARPEPGREIVKFFLLGGFMASAAAIVVEYALKGALADFNIGYYSIVGLLLFAFIEETSKFLSARVLLRNDPNFDEPIDAMIYLITVGLGFSAIENFFELGGTAFSALPDLIILRFIGATLLHAVSSGFVGFYWASGRVWRGLLIATLLHTAFNWLILGFPGLPIYPSIVLVIAAIFLLRDFDIIKTVKEKIFS